MKKTLRYLCAFFAIIISFSFVACDDKSLDNTPATPVCEHTYEFSSLSVSAVDGVERPAVYTCSKCNCEKFESVGYEEIGLPVIDFSGSLDGISKENELKIGLKYSSEELEFDCDAKIKVQGASSAAFPKKNYTIKLYKKGTDFDKKKKVELVDGWGEENKYCLKANWVDYSQARNVVSAKLFGQIVKSRNLGDEIEDLYNGGAIDGYPVVVYLNGSFLGLYTMNIPKDKWLFGMSDYDPDEDIEVKKQAILMGDMWTSSVALSETIGDSYIESGWELEYCSTEETDIGTDWVKESFNNFIEFINSNTGDDLKSGLANYVDIDRAIDCFIYTNVLYAEDNVGKNILWVTYDGVKWMPSMYDMDGVWGSMYNGTIYSDKDVMSSVFRYNKLYRILVEVYSDEITDRYIELRKNILKLSNIEKAFKDFDNLIPKFVRNAEKTKWIEVPSQDVDYISQIRDFAGKRLAFLDEYFVFS